jgi:hypothetical protein
LLADNRDLWASLFVLVERFRPTAFAKLAYAGPEFPSGAARTGQYVEMIYYSFVTLTTLGYGDISPWSALVRMLAVTEANVGQVILVVLVARLVGLPVAQSRDDAHTKRWRPWVSLARRATAPPC